MLNAERILAPILVLSLHFLLVFDVTMHRSEMLEYRRPNIAVKWVSCAFTLFFYLSAVTSDPGYLRPRFHKLLPPRPVVLLQCVFSPLCCLVAKLKSKRRSSVLPVSDSRTTRDVQERRELRPVGRPVLQSLDGLDAESDPGEEEIDLADIESAGGNIHANSVVCDVVNSSAIGKPAQPPSTLGDVPGTPRIGGARGGASKASGVRADASLMWQSGQRLRYCKECRQYQPLRSKHCRDCGRCIRTHDHHCPWIGTCVAEGNRVYFYWFLVAQSVELGIFLHEGMFGKNATGRRSLPLIRTPMLILGLVFIAFLLVFVVCLVAFHTYLAVANQTTWEYQSWGNITYLRSLEQGRGSPFSVDGVSNLAVYCCPPWLTLQYPSCCGRRATPVQRTEDNWVMWNFGDQHYPRILDCFCCSPDPDD